MAHLVFPDVATIRFMTGHPPAPLRLAGILCDVRLAAREKNDYHLGPFASDAEGVVRITGEACRAFVEAEHDSGLMDYAGVGQCSVRVEIRALTGADVARAARQRRTVWRALLRGEDRLFASIDELVLMYERAPNHRIVSGAPLTPAWDGSEAAPAYQYVVDIAGSGVDVPHGTSSGSHE